MEIIIYMTSIINKEKFIENLSDDPELIAELLEIFKSESKKLLIDLKKSMNEHNNDSIYKSVHSLKGSCSNLMVHDNIIADFQSWQLLAKTGKLTMENVESIEKIVKKVIYDLQHF